MDITWEKIISEEKKKDYYKQLAHFVNAAYKESTIYPAKKNLFRALKLTPFNQVKVVILGQDPYHGVQQAHGLSFSVASSHAKFPPSLRNIFKELAEDTGILRKNTDLSDWAEQGVLLLNTVLSVEAGKAGSHRGRGWEIFTDTLIQQLNERESPIIFVLWGNDARKKKILITNPIHYIIEGVHPSPLSAHNGFFGSKPFSKINQILKDEGKEEIFWGDRMNPDVTPNIIEELDNGCLVQTFQEAEDNEKINILVKILSELENKKQVFKKLQDISDFLVQSEVILFGMQKKMDTLAINIRSKALVIAQLLLKHDQIFCFLAEAKFTLLFRQLLMNLSEDSNTHTFKYNVACSNCLTFLFRALSQAAKHPLMDTLRVKKILSAIKKLYKQRLTLFDLEEEEEIRSFLITLIQSKQITATKFKLWCLDMAHNIEKDACPAIARLNYKQLMRAIILYQLKAEMQLFTLQEIIELEKNYVQY